MRRREWAIGPRRGGRVLGVVERSQSGRAGGVVPLTRRGEGGPGTGTAGTVPEVRVVRTLQ